MKKLIVISVIMAFILLAGSSFASAHAQDTAKEDKPTFYRLIPGVYVNGWPRFTVTYPKDWVEHTPYPQEVFRVGVSGPTPEGWFSVTTAPLSYPDLPSLDKLADHLLNFFRAAKDLTIVSDKPSRLRDGSPAREVEIKMIMNDVLVAHVFLTTKMLDLWISPGVGSRSGKISEDLKAILYSLTYQPGKDEPVKVPLDVQEFLDRNCNDLLSHDLAKIMANYSDGFLNSGWRKGEMERFWMQRIGPITSVEVGITDFVAEGDKAHLAGFISRNGAKYVLKETSIIKENGEWKWYGNQRDPAPRPRKKSHVSSPRVRRTHEKVHRYISDHSHYIVSREFLRPGLCSRPRKGGETDFLPSRPRHLCERLATFHHHLSEGLG
jgi:hypothetical protein